MTTKTVLIIDFDQKCLGHLKEALSQDGYRVLTASDGQIGWDKFIDETPDLVLIEPMLSKLHGFELCQKITSHPEYKVPVFIMTGVYKDFIYKSEALRTYGASEYFEKPLDMPKFLQAIRSAVPIPKSEPRKEAAPEPVPAKPRLPVTNPAPVPVPAPIQAAPPVPKPTVAKKEKEYAVPSMEELKSLVAEPAPKTGRGIRSEAPVSAKDDRDEIDAMLKSALSDFGLGEDRKKPAEKTRPAPPAPVSPPPRPAKRLETVPLTPPSSRPAEPPAEPAPKKAEKGLFFGPPPGIEPVAKKRDDSNGDPDHRAPLHGTGTAGPKPVPVTPPRPPLASKAETPAPQPRPGREAPEPPAAALPASPRIDRDRLSPAIFEDLHEPKKKRGLPIVAIAGAAAIVLGAAGYIFFLRPKPAPSLAPIQANVKPISTPAEPDPNTTQTPEEFSAKVEQRASQIESDLAAKAKAAAAEPPPPEIVGAPVVTVPVKPEAAGLKLAGTEVRRNGGETSAANPAVKSPAVKPPQDNPGNPPEKTGAAGGAGETVSDPVAAPPPPVSRTINEGDLLLLEEVDVVPEVLRRVNPVYPAMAQKFKLEGSITVNALVSETGSVIDTAILKGMKDDMGLEKAAADAVRKWRFEPALKNGVKVKVWRPVIILFELQK
jgi:TonB family protein